MAAMTFFSQKGAASWWVHTHTPASNFDPWYICACYITTSSFWSYLRLGQFPTEEPLDITAADFFQPGCLSCHSAKDIKVLKENFLFSAIFANFF